MQVTDTLAFMHIRREREFLLFGLSPEKKSWRGVGLLALFYFGTLLFAAIVSPWIYKGVISWAEAAPNELNLYLADKDFPRYFDRLWWLSIILVLPWLLKRCGLLSWLSLGFGSFHRAWRSAIQWLGVGLAMLGVVAIVQHFAMGINLIMPLIPGDFIAVLLMGIMSGMIVGFVEETVFRGVVLRMFYTALSPITAVIVSALFFAAVHFKKIPDSLWIDNTVSLGSGFYVGFWVMLSVVLSFEFFKFINLFFVGLILNLLFLKTRLLLPCIGLHAGWVCFRAIYRKFVDTNSEASTFIWGSEAVIDGVFPTLIMILFVIVLGHSYGRETHRR